MPYSKTTWTSGVTAIDAAPLTNLETQYEEAVDDIKKSMKPPIVRWTAPGWHWQTSANRLIVADRIYYMPIYVEETTTYIRIGINVGVGDGAAGLCDLRIFEWDNGVPGALILSAGTVATAAGGLKEIIIAEALDPGYYFLACRDDQAPQLKSPNTLTQLWAPTSGLSLVGDMLNSGIILYDDAAYADPAGAIDGTLTSVYAFVTLREN